MQTKSLYTQTIKFCPLDVYVCTFHMYARIPNDYYYKTLSLSNVLHQKEIRLIINSATDNVANTSTLKIKKNHNISGLCGHHNIDPFKHI